MKNPRRINRPKRCCVDSVTDESGTNKKLLIERELIRVALRMIMNHEPDERITRYTRLAPEKVSQIRENMFEQYYLEQQRKSEMIQKGLIFQDPQI